jgi:hypothetical protein
MTKQAARQHYAGAEEIGKMANAIDARLKLYAQGRGHLMTCAEALQLARSQGVVDDNEAVAVAAIYELNAEPAGGKPIPTKQADYLADACITICAAPFLATLDTDLSSQSRCASLAGAASLIASWLGESSTGVPWLTTAPIGPECSNKPSVSSRLL